jgi:hypothetical protein
MAGLFGSLLASSTRRLHKRSLFIWSHTLHILGQLLWRLGTGELPMLYTGCGYLIHNSYALSLGEFVEIGNSISFAMAFSSTVSSRPVLENIGLN